MAGTLRGWGDDKNASKFSVFYFSLFCLLNLAQGLSPSWNCAVGTDKTLRESPSFWPEGQEQEPLQSRISITFACPFCSWPCSNITPNVRAARCGDAAVIVAVQAAKTCTLTKGTVKGGL